MPLLSISFDLYRQNLFTHYHFYIILKYVLIIDGGHVYGFGSNSEGQLGSADEQPLHTTPVRVQGLEGITIKMLSGGADHSLALTGNFFLMFYNFLFILNVYDIKKVS